MSEDHADSTICKWPFNDPDSINISFMPWTKALIYTVHHCQTVHCSVHMHTLKTVSKCDTAGQVTLRTSVFCGELHFSYMYDVTRRSFLLQMTDRHKFRLTDIFCCLHFCVYFAILLLISDFVSNKDIDWR